MDQIDRMDVVREESLQSAVPKDRCNIISTDPDRRFSFSAVVTHIVKQSYMKATASGLIATDTSSGIGGARLRLPSL